MNIKKIVGSPKFFFLISVTILFLGYSQNLWRATDYVKYYDHYYSFLKDYDIPELKNFVPIYSTFDRFSESFVIGRLVESQKEGLLSYGGFVGRFYDIPQPPEGVNDQFFSHAYQYKIFFNNSLAQKVNLYGTIYKSQSGGQAFVLSLLDRYMPGTGSIKLTFYYRFMALFTAIATVLIIYWFYKEFGVITGWLLVVCFALFNYWTLYAKSLWWVPWAFCIPFILNLYTFRKEETSNAWISYKRILLINFIGMFIKIFLNGFEFITTTIVMVSIPLFYYALKNRWKLTPFFYRLMVQLGGITLSIIASMILLSLQFVLAGDTFVDGLFHIYNSFLARTHGTGAYTNWLVEDSTSAPLFDVVKYYFLDPNLFDFNGIGLSTLIHVKHFLAFVLGISIIWMIVGRKSELGERTNKINALNLTLWISILAPLSWFVIFKGHSYIHRQHDPIVWFMPFMFYAVALIGITIQEIISRLRLL